MPIRSLARIASTAALVVVAACFTPPPVNVTLTPSDVTLTPGQTQDFTATVTGTADTSVAWAASGGTVTGSGNTISYTAPTALGDYTLTAASVAVPSSNATAAITVVTEPDRLWGVQFGTNHEDRARGVAVDAAGNVFVVGSTGSLLPGATTHFGATDAFVAKLDADGQLAWLRQFGTATDDVATGVAVDTAGNVAIVGTTGGGLFGPSHGSDDVFVVSYAPDGSERWARQFGTGNYDGGQGVAFDWSGGVLVTGTMDLTLTLPGSHEGASEVFVAKLVAATGQHAWLLRFGGGAYHYGRAVAVGPAGNAVVVGSTTGDLFGSNHGDHDAFVAKFDADGTEVPLWAVQFGTAVYDSANGVAIDLSGNVVISGTTYGSLAGAGQHLGGSDAFVVKLDTDGGPLWARQLGTASDDRGEAVAVDLLGQVLVAGGTSGELAGPGTHQGDRDAFVEKLAPNGTPLWTRQYGSSLFDTATGVAVGLAGNVLIAGSTEGSLVGTYLGDHDAFVMKLTP